MVTKVKRLAILMLSFVIMSTTQPAHSVRPEQHIQNEQQWIVDSIGNDITGIVAYAAQKSTGEPDLKTLLCTTSESATNKSGSTLSFNYALSYQGAVKPLSTNIELSRYIWNPGNYAPWASALLARFHLKAKSASQSSVTQSASLIKELSNYSSDTLISQNKKISSALSANPLDAQLHEEAALLCATLALRERAGSFSDVRPQLNRLVAHLAVARGLLDSQKFGDAGKLAEVILCCLSGREVESSNLMKSFASRTTDDALQSWLRALRVRNTHDFRIADAKNGSRIELLEYGRALTEAVNCDALTEYLEKRHENGSEIDWLRCGLGDKKSNSLASGQLYADSKVAAEQAAFFHDYALTHDRAQLVPDAVVNQVNLAPTGGLVIGAQWRLQAISWPNLAAFHSRHLLGSVHKRYLFERILEGAYPLAQQTLEQDERSFARMKLFPVCHLDMIRKNADDFGLPGEIPVSSSLRGQVTQLILRHPDWLTFELWNLVNADLASPAIPKPTDSWFKPRLLMGTDFDYSSRRDAKNVSVEQLERLRTLAPHDKSVLSDLAISRYKHPTSDQYSEIFGAFGEYDLSIMQLIADADKSNKVKYVSRLEKMAKFQPNVYFEIGRFLEDSDPQRAVKAYEQGMKLGRDAFYKSGSCNWLVNYYYDHGERDKAVVMAKEAAAGGSVEGLSILAWLDERMHLLTDAQHIWEQMDENMPYPSFGAYKGWATFPFYVRHQDEKNEYKLEVEEISKTFAHGFVKFKKEDLASPPTYGGTVYDAKPLAKSYGINDGCIVVAVDGYRVANMADLRRNRSIEPLKKEVEVVVWDGKKYETVNAAPPDRKYGFLLHEWNAK